MEMEKSLRVVKETEDHRFLIEKFRTVKV